MLEHMNVCSQCCGSTGQSAAYRQGDPLLTLKICLHSHGHAQFTLLLCCFYSEGFLLHVAAPGYVTGTVTMVGECEVKCLKVE